MDADDYTRLGQDDEQVVVPGVLDLKNKYVEQRNRRICKQVLAFALAYSFWITVHVQREFWAMTKKVLNDEQIMKEEVMSRGFLGSLDTALFFSYSITQFFYGSVGDSYDKRWVIGIAYFIQAIG